MNINIQPHENRPMSFGHKIPQKTVIISSKRGKDVISDEFVGMHYKRESLINIVETSMEDFVDFIYSVCKKIYGRFLK